MEDKSYIEKITELLRSSNEELWVSLREELLRKGVNARSAVLVESCELGNELEFGVIVTPQHEIYRFSWDEGEIFEWENISNNFGTTPYASAIELGIKVINDEKT